jgi:hypothetical protein
VLSFGVDDHEHCRFCGIVLLPPSLHRVRSDNVTSYVSVSAIAEFVKQPVTCQSARLPDPDPVSAHPGAGLRPALAIDTASRAGTLAIFKWLISLEGSSVRNGNAPNRDEAAAAVSDALGTSCSASSRSCDSGGSPAGSTLLVT